MAYFAFGPNDIIHTRIIANPVWTVTRTNTQISGSVYLEKNLLDPLLQSRQIRGFSERLGGLVTKYSVMTASVSFDSAARNGVNGNLYANLLNMYRYHQITSPSYNLTYSGSQASQLRYCNVPQVYYDSSILTGSITLVDQDMSGSTRTLRDDGRGSIIDVATSGTVGNVFYAEGLIVLKAPYLQTFGAVSPNPFKWQVSFKGNHAIPVAIFRCRAPAGQLNASTNPTFYNTPQSGPNRGTRQVLTSSLSPYITTVGLYDPQYKLVAVARLAQPVKKEYGWDLGVKIKIDF